jgi:hypothetical protein
MVNVLTVQNPKKLPTLRPYSKITTFSCDNNYALSHHRDSIYSHTAQSAYPLCATHPRPDTTSTSALRSTTQRSAGGSRTTTRRVSISHSHVVCASFRPPPLQVTRTDDPQFGVVKAKPYIQRSKQGHKQRRAVRAGPSHCLAYHCGPGAPQRVIQGYRVSLPQVIRRHRTSSCRAALPFSVADERLRLNYR